MSRPPSVQAAAHELRQSLERHGILDTRVLDAIEQTPRHRFLSESQADIAWEDAAQAIGGGQTISQPYMVALMTEALAPTASSHVLEIGTGSGYQAAILARLCGSVVSVERIYELHEQARHVLDSLGIDNVECHLGDGTLGWPDEAPYDGIIVTAASPEIPPALVSQLKQGGRLVIPVGPVEEGSVQTLLVGTRQGDSLSTEPVCQCRFVPLIGDSDPTE